MCQTFFTFQANKASLDSSLRDILQLLKCVGQFDPESIPQPLKSALCSLYWQLIKYFHENPIEDHRKVANEPKLDKKTPGSPGKPDLIPSVSVPEVAGTSDTHWIDNSSSSAGYTTVQTSMSSYKTVPSDNSSTSTVFLDSTMEEEITPSSTPKLESFDTSHKETEALTGAVSLGGNSEKKFQTPCKKTPFKHLASGSTHKDFAVHKGPGCPSPLHSDGKSNTPHDHPSTSDRPCKQKLLRQEQLSSSSDLERSPGGTPIRYLSD